MNFSKHPHYPQTFSVRKALAGKHILLIGATGFIGKVWLSMLLNDLPELGRIYLLIRRQGSRSAMEPFERIVAESPTFKGLHERHGEGLADFLADRLEVLEGDVAAPGLGLDSTTSARLFRCIDLVVNSAGLTDFNPDLRLALFTNADGAMHLADFVRQCRHAGLVHVSTCFVNGRTDGRVPEEIQVNYTPGGHTGFDAQKEWQYLHEAVDRFTREAESPALTEQFQVEALAKHKGEDPAPTETRGFQNQVRRIRTRWIREQLIDFECNGPTTGVGRIFIPSLKAWENRWYPSKRSLPVAVVRPPLSSPR